jgi:hypothetical protein
VSVDSLVNTFYDEFGIFSVSAEKLKASKLYSDYEIRNLQNDVELQEKVRLSLEALINTENAKESLPQQNQTEKTGIINSFGKLVSINPEIIEKEIVEKLGGTTQDEFNQIVEDIEYSTVNREGLFEEMQEYKKADVFIEVEGEIRQKNNVETEITIPLTTKIITNEAIKDSLDNLLNINLDILSDNYEQTEKVLTAIENELISNGLDVVGLSKKPIDSELIEFLKELTIFINSPTKENTKSYANLSDEYFERDVTPQKTAIKIPQTSDNVVLNTKISRNGQTITVYRAQKDNRKQGVDRQSNQYGIYFSENRNSTKIYGDKIEEYVLNIQNPIVLKDTAWNLSLMPKYIYDGLITKGYDGAVWDRKGEMYEIIAFYPEQVVKKEPIKNIKKLEYVTLNTNLSEEEVYIKSGLIKVKDNLYVKSAKENLEKLYSNLETYTEKYPKDKTIQEYVQEQIAKTKGFNNAENAEAVYLYKMYFNIEKYTLKINKPEIKYKKIRLIENNTLSLQDITKLVIEPPIYLSVKQISLAETSEEMVQIKQKQDRIKKEWEVLEEIKNCVWS